MTVAERILEYLSTHDVELSNHELCAAVSAERGIVDVSTRNLYQRGLLTRERRGRVFVFRKAPPAAVNGFHHGDTPVPEPTPASEPLVAAPEPVLDPLTPLFRSLADTIASQILSQVRMSLAEQMTELIANTRREVDTLNAPTPTELAERLGNAMNPSKQRPKSVLIVGLLPSQAGQIQAEFGDVFDLRFWKNENPDLLRINAKTADYVITFTSKIGHSAEQLIKSANKPIERVSGGMTSLKTKLTELYCGPTQ